MRISLQEIARKNFQREATGHRLLWAKDGAHFVEETPCAQLEYRMHSSMFEQTLLDSKPLPERYVDAVAGAQFVGMHPKTLERLARRGTVPAHPLGEGSRRKRWRFLISELDIWLRTRKGLPR